jgi:[acyl-carrier-protein] S-malonyltransferase
MSTPIAATVGGRPVRVSAIDERESRLRSSGLADTLPRTGTSEGRQLRRWLTQLVVTDVVVQHESEALGVAAGHAPDETELLPDMAARLEIGSVAAAALEQPLARALFGRVTDAVQVGDDAIVEYHQRNPMRFARPVPGPDGWLVAPTVPPTLEAVWSEIAAELLGSARRQAFRRWLDARRTDLVHLEPGYEHPGDPRQPDHVHRH